MPGSRKRLGYWLSQKKCKKLSFSDIEDALRERDIEPVKIDLEEPIDKQGPFNGILHKLTDFIAKAENGDDEGQKVLQYFESYIQDNPSVLVMDSIACLRTLINRYKTYCIINKCQLLNEETAVFIPPFVELQTNVYETNVHLLRLSKVNFPAVCKPVIAHGSSAHQMTLIFNESGLKDAIYPCVVQTFVNHNAVLYKLFALGRKYTTVLRPSIKNFNNCEDLASIRFDGGEISKPNSSSRLAVQDEREVNGHLHESPCPKILNRIVQAINESIGLGLFGVDVIVEASTGRIAIVDVNAFPGYEGVTDFPGRLADFVREELDKSSHETSVITRENGICNGTNDCRNLTNFRKTDTEKTSMA
ncbi:Inositol-tetrakisphosphate 1-kinase [Orchesella cincta]|uniref:Inositol-tetrakisphosphate 1-kinase n=1 Tax=Orchesella cincta TaxID=48709 RepID=A0A1D2NGF8_ORCCI|nr:Inositol-tetrakisphosphate 1-kinase [Orchesella cincta]